MIVNGKVKQHVTVFNWLLLVNYIMLIGFQILGHLNWANNKTVEFMLIEFKALASFILCQCMLLSFYLLLFRFRLVEIQIDSDIHTVPEIIANLKRYQRYKQYSIAAFIITQTIYFGFYSVSNILMEMGVDKSNFMVPKTINLAGHLPCTTVLLWLSINFFKMGMRFVKYFEDVQSETTVSADHDNQVTSLRKRKPFGLARAFVILIFSLNLLYQLSFLFIQALPLIYLYRGQECPETWWNSAKRVIVGYWYVFLNLQGIIMLVLLKNLTFNFGERNVQAAEDLRGGARESN